MRKNISINAYAKLNLSLDIVGIREDNYHLLRTVMQSISIYDTLKINRCVGDKITLSSDDDTLILNEENSAYKAAKTFLEAVGIADRGISIYLEKRIPSQAGLGGASADAAAVLIGLNWLYGAGLSTSELCDIGVEIGADVPFCIVGGTQLCEGIGEIITPVTKLADCYIVVAKPAGGISTPKAYAEFDRIYGDPDVNAKTQEYTDDVMLALTTNSLSQVGSAIGNVFEQLAEVDEVASIKEVMLSMGAVGASMSGSGTAVYGLFNIAEYESAMKCMEYLRSQYPFSVICRPINK
ncbi:MAG: 4-(cytidine 5'-diphospho)-2-C-methyl-D-erythritol kinase [Clostridiales bacterium]|nr:4-(cytidine 5'-diphospho)-2-C-methyl-D-erythritol kinase [Clostridiales bacterium]